MAHHLDRAIEALARKQHGAFSSSQVNELGGSRQSVHRRVTSGQWVRLDQGVFALAGHPPTLLRQMKAAQLAVPHSAISGLSAAALHQFPDIRVGRIEVTTTRNGGSTPLARVRHRHPVPTTAVDGIAVTTAAQTLADIADRVPSEVLGDAIEFALRASITTFADLAVAWQTARDRRAPSARPFRAALRLLDPESAVAASVLESRLYRVLDDPRLPAFVRQAPAPWAPEGAERVDAAFPTVRWIVEGDGRAWHTRVDDFERDRRRDHLAQVIGWSVTRFTLAQIDTPGYVVDTLARAFDERRRAA
ncbi:MAG TPA: type IV toxin-antitoxin system AbiEi family antitoxin domain-containing protein [Acidimicrobiales bacterium]